MSTLQSARRRGGNVLTLFPLFVGIMCLAFGGIAQGLLLLAGAVAYSPRTGFHPGWGVALIAAGLVVAA